MGWVDAGFVCGSWLRVGGWKSDWVGGEFVSSDKEDGNKAEQCWGGICALFSFFLSFFHALWKRYMKRIAPTPTMDIFELLVKLLILSLSCSFYVKKKCKYENLHNCLWLDPLKLRVRVMHTTRRSLRSEWLLRKARYYVDLGLDLCLGGEFYRQSRLICLLAVSVHESTRTQPPDW